MNPTGTPEKRTLKRISPLSAGKILAILYGVMGLFAIPLFLFMSVATANLPPQQRGIFALVGLVRGETANVYSHTHRVV